MASVAMCNQALVGSTTSEPLGTVVLLVPLGLLVWTLGYLAFAVGCYGIQRSWIMIRGYD